MKLQSLEAIFRALQDSGARYLVVGGVAVIAHGYVRLTKNLDLVLDSIADSLPLALAALESLGYRSTGTVALRDFADSGSQPMTGFNLISNQHPRVPIVIFFWTPAAFETEYKATEWKEVGPNLKVPLASAQTLIALKEEGSRDLDPVDVEMLHKLYSPQIQKVGDPGEPWPCDWEGHELMQLRRGASCPFRKNLEWLEDTTEFAYRLTATASYKRPLAVACTN